MSKKKQNNNEHIQVYVRCRPFLKSELNLPSQVEVHPEVNKILVRENATEKCSVKSFTFDKVFGPNAKQADIYADVVAPKIREVIMGFNCTIFAYGQTGTGKTFTIEGGRTPGLKDASEDPLSGVIPRSMKHLFSELAQQNKEFEICVSFLELYNEEIFDLLSKNEDSVKLKMFDNAAQKGSVIVQGLEIRAVNSMEEVYNILDAGCKKRRKAATLLNKASSRSHTVFTVNVSLKESSCTFEKMKSGKLNLVDLAGSENIGRSGAMDKRAREAGNINQSLLALGRVITSLCEKAGHIPYRQSKLTRLLQDSLGGQTKTAVIATISPAAAHIDETLNTLEYALRAKNITNKPEVNAQFSASKLTKDYKKEIIRLRKQIRDAVTEDGCYYMPEEMLGYWESNLVSKKREKFKILSEINDQLKEEKQLEPALQEANAKLTERKNYVDNLKSRNEELRKELEREKEDQMIYSEMLQKMQPLHDHLHEKLHKCMEENRELELEVMKMKSKLKSAAEELKDKKKTRRSWCDRRKERNDRVLLNTENLLKDVQNMHLNANSLTSECKNCVSTLENDFQSAIILVENEFKNIFEKVSDLKAAGASFKANIESSINEEKCKKLKWVDKFSETYLASNESQVLEPLFIKMEDCETSLLGISAALHDFKNYIFSEVDSRKSLVTEHLKNQKNSLDSVTHTAKILLDVQKENLDGCNDMISECVKYVSEDKKLWNDQFLSLERALSSLDLFCTDRAKCVVDKAAEAESSMKNKLSQTKNEISEKLTTYCENSFKDLDIMEKEINTHNMNEFSSKFDKTKRNVTASGEMIKHFSSQLARVSSLYKDVAGNKRRIEDALADSFKSLEEPVQFTNSQGMFDSISKWEESFKTYFVENRSKLEALLTNDKSQKEKLFENSQILSKPFEDDVPNFIQCIETELKSINSAEEDTGDEDNTLSNTLIEENKTKASPECEKTSIEEHECPVCIEKGTDRVFQTGDDKYPPREGLLKAEYSVMNSSNISCEPGPSGTSFMSRFSSIRPGRYPRRKKASSVRRILDFVDVEQLERQLFQNSSEEET